jgi:hypothetical protein
MKIEQTAGDVSLVVYTDGAPLFPQLTVAGGEPQRLTVNSLHDLRYCIDRVLAQLPKDR